MSMDFEGLGVFYLGRDADDAPLLYDAADLTTHACVVGMTGSGKTGLGVALIEEAALDGVPVIAIDPKGDLGNLLLTFPDLAPTDFEPWVDPAAATREGITPAALAEQTAARWRDGLASWGQGPDRIRALRAAADIALYTPGSSAGRPLALLRSLDPPPADARDGDAFQERVDTAVASLLSLLSVDADPLQDPEHVFLAAVLTDAWRRGESITLARLVGALQEPPMNKIGVMEVDTFFPPRQRTALAMRINGLLASPSFAAWARGEPLDAGRLLYAADGRPRVSILSIAHLDDQERMFFVTRLLGEVVAWMRRQPGTTSLRAVLYMDEIFGYLPPTANPPSKRLFLTLLKQARAFGLGLVLATQNPVDLDYKALSNCGTWFVGRLQTERDKARLLDGLEGAAQSGLDRSETDRLLSGIPKRTFLLHNVHDPGSRILSVRWVMSYLAGPLTREQIKRLVPDDTPAPATAPPPSLAAATAADAPATLDVAAPFVVTDAEAPTLRAHLTANASVRYDRRRPPVQHTRELVALAPDPDDFDAAIIVDHLPPTSPTPPADARFAPVPDAFRTAAARERRRDAVAAWLKSNATLTLFEADEPRLRSEPGEDERAFRARLQLAGREARDAARAALRERYAPRVQRLEDQIARAQQAVDREADQASRKTTDSAVAIGLSVLDAVLGGRRRSARSRLSRVGTAARSASAARKERQDVSRAEQRVADLQARLADLELELQHALDDLDLAPPAAVQALRTVTIRPKEVTVNALGLVWAPPPDELPRA